MIIGLHDAERDHFRHKTTGAVTGKKHGTSIAGGKGSMGNCENCIHEYDCDWEDAEDCEEYVEE